MISGPPLCSSAPPVNELLTTATRDTNKKEALHHRSYIRCLLMMRAVSGGVATAVSDSDDTLEAAKLIVFLGYLASTDSFGCFWWMLSIECPPSYYKAML